MIYDLYGYSLLYTKESGWVFINSYPTEEKALAAKAFRLERPYGRINGGFDAYKIVKKDSEDG